MTTAGTRADPRRERAQRLSATERREAVVAATRPLLLEHGRATTTRLVAEACGIAEGTIFRVFDSLDDLFAEVLQRELDPGRFLERLAQVDLDQPLRERLLEAVTVLQQRFVDLFAMMTAMALTGPPTGLGPDQRRRQALEGLLRLVEPDAAAFRMPPEDVVRLLRLLTFSGSHPHLAHDHVLSPDEIVDAVLHGSLAEPGLEPTAPDPTPDPTHETGTD